MQNGALNPAGFLPLTPVALEILLAVGDDARHGYDVLLAIEARTGGQVSPNPGTLYRAIDRLVREGLLESELRRAGRNGPQRVYRISRLGARVATAEFKRLAGQINAGRQMRVFKVPGRS